VCAYFKRAFEVVTITKTRMVACQWVLRKYFHVENPYFMRVTSEVVTISPQDFQKHALHSLIFALHYVSTLIAQTGLPHPEPFSKDVAERTIRDYTHDKYSDSAAHRSSCETRNDADHHRIADRRCVLGNLARCI